MLKVLLTHSNHVLADPKQRQRMQPYPPLQTILAASYLRAHGIEAHLFDPALEYSPDALSSMIFRVKPDWIAVCEDDFNFLSKMCLGCNRQLGFEIAGIAADCGIRCVAHGADASDHPGEYLRAGFEAVLAGEVEATLLDVVQGKPFQEVDGLIWHSQGGLVRNRPRKPVADLDSWPRPAWDLVDIEQYRCAWKGAHGYFSLNLASSRGCPYRCNWCAKPVYGNAYRALSPRNVAREMAHLKRTYAAEHIWFADDIFALSRRWTFDFAREVERSGAKLPFKMQSRCDLMTRDNVSALGRAGCEEVWMGAESGSQQILDAMDKDLSVSEIYSARENLRRHGIRACFFLQFGYPGEQWTDIEATIRMIRETKPDDLGISVSYPLPGTKFHQIVSAAMGSKSNWDHSADLTMMFQNSFSTEFYRALADALHIEVRGGEGGSAAWSRVEELLRGEVAA